MHNIRYLTMYIYILCNYAGVSPIFSAEFLDGTCNLLGLPESFMFVLAESITCHASYVIYKEQVD